jgi:pimeloyl-ACP methyl ester carboxylesterase
MTSTPPPPRVYGTWPGGLPFLSIGSGPPLVYLAGITPNHEPPRGSERRFVTRQLLPFAASRRVWWVNRRPGLSPDATMADIAADYAKAMLLRFDEPVDVIGQSTGGSVALQLAADHPAVVRRLVVVSAAYRLSEEGRDTQLRVADNVLDGRPRAASAELMGMLGAGDGAQRMLRGLGWLLGKAYFAHSTADLITTIRAEDSFDLRNRLADIVAPTLVIGGERDAFYSDALFRQTAAEIPRGTLALYDGRGHAGTTLDRRFVPDVLSFLGAPDAQDETAGWGKPGEAWHDITD